MLFLQQRYKSRVTDGVLDEAALADSERDVALAIQEVENRKKLLAPGEAVLLVPTAQPQAELVLRVVL